MPLQYAKNGLLGSCIVGTGLAPVLGPCFAPALVFAPILEPCPNLAPLLFLKRGILEFQRRAIL